MDNIDDIVNSQQQKLPNEEELKVKLTKANIKNYVFLIKEKAKLRPVNTWIICTNMSIEYDIGFL